MGPNSAAVPMPAGPYPLLSCADLKTADQRETSWLWHGYLVSGGVTVLTSQWKAGKSTLLSVLLARLKTGGELAGRALTAARAVVVSEESPSIWRDRGQVLAFDDHVHWICRPFLAKPRPDEWLALLEQIGRLHDQAGVDLLAIDSLANLSPMRSENDAVEMLRTLLPLQRLTSRGLSILLAHHPKKGRLVPGQAARGSGALPAFADIIVEMQPVARRNPQDRRRRLRAYSRHDATPASWVIEWTADGTDYVGLGPSAEPDFERGWPLLEGILAAAERALTRREIHQRWPDLGVVPAKLTLWRWLDRVVKEGQVLQDGLGTRKDPFRYQLPGMVEKWQATFMDSFLKQLETGPGPAGPAPEVNPRTGGPRPMTTPDTSPNASGPPSVRLMRSLGLEPDPWQVEVLEGGHARLLLNCCRQAGKSTVVALLGLAEAVFVPFTKVLLVSRSLRQSTELFRIVLDYHRRLGAPLLHRQTAEELQLENHSRVVCLPCREETIRGYSNVSLLVLDEAARVPDDLYRAVRPMLAVSNGRLICLSTPYGKRGFFYDVWAHGGDDWHRIEVPADRIPRIRPEFLVQERRGLGESWYRQEYLCSFEALEGLVYPDFARCVVAGPAPAGGRKVGGIDFGFRNPFAAVWGTVDRDGVLWLTDEHYARQKPLSYHAAQLPRDVTWYADPSGANERSELHCAGFTVREGSNALRPGIAAVSARLENGMLRVVAGRCPNLLAEAALYRYSDAVGERHAEVPVDEHNHALAALRYLISKLDARQMAGPRPVRPPDGAPPRKPRPWLRYDNEDLWTRLW